MGLFQFHPVLGDIDKNCSLIIQGIKQFHGDLLVLPELAFSGYALKNRDAVNAVAEAPHQSRALSCLQSLCQEKNCHIVAGFAEQNGEKTFNSSALVGPNGVVSIYRKIHLFGFEQELFSPGDGPPIVTNLGHTRVGMMICFDWMFPEVARTLALDGADIIAHPANLVMPWCPQAMVTRCLENHVYSITANRVGKESRSSQELHFIGQSRIISPAGEVLGQGHDSASQLLEVDIDVMEARNKTLASGNDLFSERQPQLYSSKLHHQGNMS